MSTITAQHFGMNIVLTKDSAKDGSAFRGMTGEVKFSNFRYPGGGVTEDQTWDNGGLNRMFGDPMVEGTDNYCMTIREAFTLAENHGASISIVVPTFQFYNTATGAFDHLGFDQYLENLKNAIIENPGSKISGLEIGNEYWAKISASDYGKIANIQIPKLMSTIQSINSELGTSWETPKIGIQAGAAWKQHGIADSIDIANEISFENRSSIDVIYQHAYPNPYKSFDEQLAGALDPVEAFRTISGFRSDYQVTLSEFNMGIHSGDQPFYGVNQGTLWIEELHRHVSSGVDAIDHWGGAYKWLTTKMYDAKFPPAEGYGNDVWAKATPVGQVLDIASSELIGLRTITDEQATQGMQVSDDLSVTGFSSNSKRVVFLGNMNANSHLVDIQSLKDAGHLSVRHIIPSNSPHTPWHDESNAVLSKDDMIIDARSDMKVVSGHATPDKINIGENELVVVTITEPGKGVFLEGAHNVTDDTKDTVRDYIVGSNGNDLLMGHVGNDTLCGNAGNNVLVGGRGSDVLIGGTGTDIIISDHGSDHITTGSGSSLVLVSGGDQNDVVLIDAELGSNLILVDGTRSIVITGLSPGSVLGFGHHFETREEFLSSAREEDGDAIIQFHNGMSMVVVDGSWLLQEDGQFIYDFWHADDRAEVADQFLSPLYLEQLNASYDFFFRLAEGGESAASTWVPFEEYSGRAVLGYTDAPDENGDETSPPEVDIPTAPVQPDRESDTEEEQNDDGSGGACFVATAAYGDRMHPDVVALRAFRDNHLCKTAFGRAFIKVYWTIGPELAKITNPDKIFGKVCRLVLSQLVRILGILKLTCC